MRFLLPVFLVAILLIRSIFVFIEYFSFRDFLEFDNLFLFEGHVCREPSYSGIFGQRARFLFCIQKILYAEDVSFSTQTAKGFVANTFSGRVFLSLPRYPQLHEGDFLVVRGLSHPQIIEHRSSRSFLLFLRQFFLRRLQNLYSEPSSSFLAGITVGFQPSLPSSVREDFRRLGLLHILVVSGYNVSLFLSFLNTFLVFLSRKKRFLFLSVGLFFFLLFVGFSPPAVRASLMGFFPLVAIYFGRSHLSLRAFFYALFGMLIVDPLLIFDLSFQLSFLSTSGILFIFPLFSGLASRLSFFSERATSRWLLVTCQKSIVNSFFEIFLLTVAVQIATLPILFLFGEFSVIAPFANVFLTPFVPYFMIFGITSFLLPFLSPLFAFFVEQYLSLVHIFAAVPFASIFVQPFSWKLVVLYYCFLLFIVFRFRKSKWAQCFPAAL